MNEKNTGRLIAIGDIHGCLAALHAVLAAIDPTPADTIVTLGDYVDRGPDSCGVLETLIGLRLKTEFVPLLGNHDEMLLSICRGRSELLADWLMFGGDETLASYDTITPVDVWPSHLTFLDGCRIFYEAEHHLFVHGNYRANEPLDRQPREVLIWESLKRHVPGQHFSGKTAILGHTAQKSGEVLDLGHLKCIDTWCYGDGWLTAMDVLSGQVWQADKRGKRRV